MVVALLLVKVDELDVPPPVLPRPALDRGPPVERLVAGRRQYLLSLFLIGLVKIRSGCRRERQWESFAPGHVRQLSYAATARKVPVSLVTRGQERCRGPQ
jgi:hypothetical protein